MNGRVAVLKGYRKPIEIEEFPVPDPEPGGMILKMEMAAICGSDLHAYRAETEKHSEIMERLGFGHEGFGRVYKLGKGVTKDNAGNPLKEGDRVVHALSSDETRMPSVDGLFGRKYGQFPYFFSTFADYFYVAASKAVYKVPDELPDEIVAPINCAMGTAISSLIVGGTKFGSRVVLQGAGGLGLTAAAAAKDMGASQVIILDRIPQRLELAKQFGADLTINIDEYPTAEARVARVRELTGGKGADVVIELAGLVSLLPEGVNMLGNGGTFVETGVYFGGFTVPFDPSTILRGAKKIVGNPGYPSNLLPTVIDFMMRTKDKYPFAQMVSHKFKLADINKALEIANWSQKQPTVTRAVLVP